MKYDPDIHHRRSIRLREYDYSSTGAYFVTTCTQGRECLFGDVVDEAIRLDPAGESVWAAWDELPERFPNIVMDEFVVMPNHFHGIIILNEPDDDVDCRDSDGIGGTYYPDIQIHDHQRLHKWCQRTWLAAVSGPLMATQLLRTGYPG